MRHIATLWSTLETVTYTHTPYGVRAGAQTEPQQVIHPSSFNPRPSFLLSSLPSSFLFPLFSLAKPLQPHSSLSLENNNRVLWLVSFLTTYNSKNKSSS